METAKELKEDSFSIKLSVYDFNQLLISGKKLKLVITDGSRAIQREIPITINKKEDLSVVTEEEASKIIGILMYGGSIWEAARETNRSTEVVDKVFKEFQKNFK